LGYRRLKLRGGYSYLREGASLDGVEALIFDVDGVLIDSSSSYDMAVLKTYEYLCSRLFGRIKIGKDALLKALYRLRDSGGFNCDWDSLYVMLLFTFQRMPLGYKEEFFRFKFEGLDPYERLSAASELPKFEVELLEEELLEFVRNADSRGLRSIEERMLRDRYLKRFRDFLDYRSGVWHGLLPYVFDEIYYGRELFEEQHDVKPRLGFEGLIRFERLLVERETLDRLSRFRLGLLTGRSRVGTYHTLGELVGYFEEAAQAFSEDEPRFKKPDPRILALQLKRLKVNKAIYVGDSMEDLLMTKGARGMGFDVLFAGVYEGLGYRDGRLELFMENGADLLIPDVNSLPEVLKVVG